MKKYLMKSAAAIVIGLAASACSHDLGFDSSAERASIDNAQETLGFYIPENQDWVMSSMVSANLPITGTEGETYTVKVYSNDPLVDNIGYILAQKEVKSGENFVSDFRAPSYLTNYVVGITNIYGQTTYKSAKLENGVLTNLTDINSARTRAISDMEAGANKNRNLWAATDNIFKLLVPTPLTKEQKDRVRAYFQTHRYLTWETPDMTNYFVQQVYTGGTKLTGSLSAETYTSGNGASVTGGQHMDKLTVTYNNVHVLDFNAANNVNTATDVKNNGTLTNDTKYHSDQITLMIGTQPTCVGYHDSESSLQHNDCCALVSAKEIDDWARAQSPVIGDDVWYGTDQYGYENSFWNRSFVGLDYEETPVEQIYTTKWVWNGTTTVEEEYAKALDFCSDMNNTHWALYHGQYVDINSIQNDYLLNPAGQKVHWVKDDTNMYLGENLGTTQNTFNKEGTINGTWAKYYDLDAVQNCVNQNALPKVNNMEFIKNLGGRDYYYSDWIVTLAEAKNITITEEKQIWSYAFEDSNRKSDYDMNDVVVKVQESMDGTKLNFKLVAAGCEYSNEVYFNGTVITWNNGSTEVHDALGVAKGVLTNTKARTGVDGKTPATASITKPAGFDPQLADIKIKPSSGDVATQADGGDGFVHIAETGKQPTGIIIPWDWSWPTERTSIVNAYNKPGHSFAGWASDNDNLRRVEEADWFKYPTGSVTE